MTMLFCNNTTLKVLRVIRVGPNIIQTATITGRYTRGGPACLPKRFPYEEKKFGFLDMFTYNTMLNMSQENARIIVVEGPIGVGKSSFCSLLAEQFDMHYIPQPTMDACYILPSGYDLRQHDDELPEEVRTYDHKNFCIDPTNKRAAIFQYFMMYLRFYQYIDAMCHMLNTGQGVVLERSYFSNFVFSNAMCEQKFISKNVINAFSTIYDNTSLFLTPPHLIIYLDIPVPVVQERIRTRNYSWEQNSPALTKEYLTSLENNWKHNYLKNARAFSEILIYDWSDGGEIEVVIDDIEKIDFDILRSDNKFKKWWFSRNDLLDMRRRMTNSPQYYERFFYHPWYKVDEVYISQDILSTKIDVYEKIPESFYDVGYNPKTDGFWKILFSNKMYNHRSFKFHLNLEGIHPNSVIALVIVRGTSRNFGLIIIRNIWNLSLNYYWLDPIYDSSTEENPISGHFRLPNLQSLYLAQNFSRHDSVVL